MTELFLGFVACLSLLLAGSIVYLRRGSEVKRLSVNLRMEESTTVRLRKLLSESQSRCVTLANKNTDLRVQMQKVRNAAKAEDA